MRGDSKLQVILEGKCECRLCRHKYNLEKKDETREIYLRGCSSYSGEELIDVEVDIIWECPECGYKNKEERRLKVK